MHQHPSSFACLTEPESGREMLKFLISEAQMRVRALLSIAMTDVTRLKRGKWDTHSDPWVFVPLGSSLLSILSSFLQVMVDTTFSPLVYYCRLPIVSRKLKKMDNDAPLSFKTDS